MSISVKSLVQIAFYALIIGALVVINLNQLSLIKADEENPISAPITSPEMSSKPTPAITPVPTNPPTNNNGGFNGGSSSGGSSNSHNVPSCNDQRPNNPVLLGVTKISPSQVIVTWGKPVGPVSSYVLSYGLTPNKMLYGVPNTGNANTYIVKQLNPKSNYYFQVRATNGCATGDTSNTLGINGKGKVLGEAITNTDAVNNITKSKLKNVAIKTNPQPQKTPTPVQEIKKVESNPTQNFFNNFIYNLIRLLYR